MPARPQHFLVRPGTKRQTASGVMIRPGPIVPLVAVDQLPPWLDIAGAPRALSIDQTAGLGNLGTVAWREEGEGGGFYDVRICCSPEDMMIVEEEEEPAGGGGRSSGDDDAGAPPVPVVEVDMEMEMERRRRAGLHRTVSEETKDHDNGGGVGPSCADKTKPRTSTSSLRTKPSASGLAASIHAPQTTTALAVHDQHYLLPPPVPGIMVATHASLNPPRPKTTSLKAKAALAGLGPASGSSSSSSHPLLLPPDLLDVASMSPPCCRHWCARGTCKWGRACRYRHAMPTTAAGLAEAGLRELPAWWTAAVVALSSSSSSGGQGYGHGQQQFGIGMGLGLGEGMQMQGLPGQSGDHHLLPGMPGVVVDQQAVTGVTGGGGGLGPVSKRQLGEMQKMLGLLPLGAVGPRGRIIDDAPLLLEQERHKEANRDKGRASAGAGAGLVVYGETEREVGPLEVFETEVLGQEPAARGSQRLILAPDAVVAAKKTTTRMTTTAKQVVDTMYEEKLVDV